MRKEFVLGLGLAASLLVVSGCSDAEDDRAAEPTEQESTEQESTDQAEPDQSGPPEPDLAGIPDVVAVVNGTEITRDDFVLVYEAQYQQRAAQAQTSGQDVDEDQLKEQTAESLIGTELLMQEGAERGLEATPEDVEAALADLAEQNGMESPEDFVAAMGQQGMDEDTVRAELEKQVTVERVMADEAGDTEPTEAELRELYDQAVAQQEQAGSEAGELPPFDEVRPQLEEQVRSTKETEALQALVEDLRSGADVTVTL